MMRLFISLLLIAPLTALAQSQPNLIRVSDDESFGDRVRLGLSDVAAGNVTLEVFRFDVPENIRDFTVALTPLEGNRNVDVLLRAEQPVDTSSFTALYDTADFLGASLDSQERVVVQDSSTPAAPGRTWFLTLVVFEGAGGEVGLSLDYSQLDPAPVAFLIDFDNQAGDPDCETAPWDDSTPFTATGGNNASTLGEARRNAMIEAAAQLSEELFSPVPVRVLACWESAGGSQTEATVANARPLGALHSSPGLAKQEVLHARAVVERRAGTEFCSLPLRDPVSCDSPDIEIQFNVDVDSPDVLGDTSWYYGLQPGGAGEDLEFVQVAMHELTHGLGFTSLINSEGDLGTSTSELSDAYTEHLVDNRSGDPVPIAELPSDAARQEAITSGDGLQWNGPESSINLMNDLVTVEDSFVQMYAPSPFEAGSSVTHLSLDYCELMLPRSRAGCEENFRSLGLAKTMLHEVGWSPGPIVPPYLGQMFDPARNGHGFEFQLGAVLADGTELYVLTFYSYEALGGAPEWFQATGVIENGVFYGSPTLVGENGLEEFNYDASRSPPQQPAPGHRGHVVLSFNNPEGSAACNDGVDRSSAQQFAVMQWIIDGQVDEWCMVPLVPKSALPSSNDFGGLWFNADDGGWGFSIENILNADGSRSLFVLVFVYADDGTPVWYFGFAEGFVPGEPITMDLFQRTGLSRLINSDLSDLSDAPAGTLTLTLVEPSGSLDAGNEVSIDVTYLGIEGGRWFREDLPIQRLTQPR